MPTEPRVLAIPCPFGKTGGIVYVYYVDAPQPALIDTGVASSPGANIEPALNAAGVSLKDVRWILATHGHWDHIGGAHAARSLASDQVTLALHADDAQLLQSRRTHMQPEGYQALRFRYLDDMAALAEHDAMLMENLSGELAADRELHGGEQISLGGDVSVEVVHTPGHSPGSATFVISGLDWAFTGDGVQVGGSLVSAFPLYVDPIAYGSTQRRLLEDVRPRRMHMGHRFRALDGTVLGSVVDGSLAVEKVLRDSLAMHERVVAAARTVTTLDLAHPTAAALEPAAQALAVTGESATWPASFFTTMHGHLARAAARA